MAVAVAVAVAPVAFGAGCPQFLNHQCPSLRILLFAGEWFGYFYARSRATLCQFAVGLLVCTFLFRYLCFISDCGEYAWILMNNLVNLAATTEWLDSQKVGFLSSPSAGSADSPELTHRLTAHMHPSSLFHTHKMHEARTWPTSFRGRVRSPPTT